MYFGIQNSKDIYPSNLTHPQAIKIFLSMFNANFPEFKIPLKYAQIYNSLSDIFKFRAYDLIKFSNLKKQNRVNLNFCCVSNSIISAFLSGKTLPQTFQTPKNKVAKFIQFFANGFIFEANDLFLDFVFWRIKNTHKDKIVEQNGDFIELKQNGKTIFSLLPSFKFINQNYENDLFCELFAMSQKHKICQNDIFVVVPRHEGFSKFINLNLAQNVRSRLVPYSICGKFQLKEEK